MKIHKYVKNFLKIFIVKNLLNLIAKIMLILKLKIVFGIIIYKFAVGIMQLKIVMVKQLIVVILWIVIMMK